MAKEIFPFSTLSNGSSSTSIQDAAALRRLARPIEPASPESVMPARRVGFAAFSSGS